MWPLLLTMALLGQTLDFSELDGQLKVLEQERLVIVAHQRHLAANIQENQKQMASLEDEQMRLYRHIRQRLLAYKSLQPTVKTALLTRSTSVEEVLRQLQLMRLITHQDKEVLRHLQETQSRIGALRGELIKNRQELLRYQAANEQKQDELAALRLDAMKVLLAAAGQAPAAAADFAALRGQLPWPVAGQLVDSGNKSLTIAAAAAAVVTAVGPGTVLFSGPVPGYHQLVIIDHGDNYYSIYGHLSRAAVEQGTLVESGQLVGLLAGARAPDQPTLYFELRHKKATIEALPWLLPVGTTP